MNARRRLGLFVLGTALLGGCGFHLKGQVVLPFKTFYTDIGEQSPLRAALRRQLANGTRLVDKITDAEGVFSLTGEWREREVVGVSSAGRPRDVQLRYRITFRIHNGKGANFTPPSEILIRRDVTAGDDLILAKQAEEELLFQEMQADAAQQILRRLAAIKPATPLPP